MITKQYMLDYTLCADILITKLQFYPDASKSIKTL